MAKKVNKPQEDAKKEKKEKKGKKVRPSHPDVDVEGKHPFKQTPADFDPAKHAKLKKGDFEDDLGYLRHKAWLHRWDADRIYETIRELEVLGNKEQRKQAKKLSKLQADVSDLEKQLREQGVNVDQLLETLKNKKG